MYKWLITAAGSVLFASIACGQYKTNPAPAAPVQTAPAPAAPISYPLGDLETDLTKKTAESKLPKNKFIITYCA
jgi:hypothetical protein